MRPKAPKPRLCESFHSCRGKLGCYLFGIVGNVCVGIPIPGKIPTLGSYRLERAKLESLLIPRKTSEAISARIVFRMISNDFLKTSKSTCLAKSAKVLKMMLKPQGFKGF